MLNNFETSFLRPEMRVKYIPPIKIEDFDDIFYVFDSNWDSHRLEKFKDVKALFLNNADQAFAIGEIETDYKDKSIDQKTNLAFDIIPVLDKASDAGASSLILAESCLPGDVYSNDIYREELLSQFNKVAESYKLKVVDYVSISSTSNSSLNFQKYYSSHSIM